MIKVLTHIDGADEIFNIIYWEAESPTDLIQQLEEGYGDPLELLKESILIYDLGDIHTELAYRIIDVQRNKGIEVVKDDWFETFEDWVDQCGLE